MRLEKVQEALKTKKIHYEYTEENGCGSIDFMREITRKLFPEKSSHGRICCLGCKYVTVHSNTLQGVEICEK